MLQWCHHARGRFLYVHKTELNTIFPLLQFHLYFSSRVVTSWAGSLWGQSRLSSLGSLDPTSSIAESLVLFSPEWASWVKEKELVMVPDRFHFYMVGRVRRSNYCLLLRPDWQPSGGRRYEDNGKGEKSRQWACRDHVRRQVWALHADHTTHVAKYIYTFHLNFTHICVTRR